ncbi:hypothetical protein AMJ44_11830 [candidate division WOR-1 bacterium DG_54_3]|uniref:DUF1622 domain-containing protein n=1 Tax=candidate division WOR-1 bacterium DG_54_3 TaxID=1703775 RepID=A0A0S7XRA2_UNCSA|nr:MAG: hypothetical protein AMJ44_11830 [candidate division WOR-1 bacterium DG_54_3]
MTLYVLLDYLVYTVSILGMLIIVWGVLLVTRDFVLELLSEDPKSKRLMRQKLGSYLILGLEFFIAADIIRTIVRPDWNEIGMLAAIIALRTVLSYFLGMELREKA